MLITSQRPQYWLDFCGTAVQVQQQLPYLRLFNRPAFPGRRGAVFLQVEGNKWMVSLALFGHPMFGFRQITALTALTCPMLAALMLLILGVA